MIERLPTIYFPLIFLWALACAVTGPTTGIAAIDACKYPLAFLVAIFIQFFLELGGPLAATGAIAAAIATYYGHRRYLTWLQKKDATAITMDSCAAMFNACSDEGADTISNCVGNC
jgi:hypothetical protein